MAKHILAIYPCADGNSYDTHYEGERAGVWSMPLLDGARWLLDTGKAEKDDTVEVHNRGKLRLRANVGRAAQLTVRSSYAGMQFVKWRGRKNDDHTDSGD